MASRSAAARLTAVEVICRPQSFSTTLVTRRVEPE